VRAALLSEWPIERPRDWTRIVNSVMPQAKVQMIRTAIERDRPLGNEAWVRRMAAKLGLEHTLRPRGRPRKQGQRR
jgi:putative transposase